MEQSEFNKFHEDLVQWICNYLKNKGIPENAWMLHFTIDDIQTLLKYGKWTPYNDSYLSFTDAHGNELLWQM